MLKNEIYIGNMVQGRYESISYKSSETRARPKNEWYIVKGTHEPIIDIELWNRVQKMIGERTKPFSTGQIGIFAKKARCASCGYVLRSSKSGGRRYLSCPNHHFDKDSCEGAFISEERLERIVIDELARLSAEYLDKAALEALVDDGRNNDATEKRILSEISLLKKRMDEMSRGIQELYLDKVRGLVGESDFVELSKNFTERRENFKRKLNSLEKRLAECDAERSSLSDRSAIIEKYVNAEHLTRETVEIMVEKIVIGKRVGKTRNVLIEIYWNF